MISQISVNRLRRLHEATGMSQADVVEDLRKKTGIGIHQTAYSFYLRGEKNPTVKTVAGLCHYFDVSFEYLIGEVDDPRPMRTLIEENKVLHGLHNERDVVEKYLSLPDDKRAEIAARIHSAAIENQRRQQNEQRWKELSQLVAKMDTDGSIRAMIESELGVAGSNDSVVERATHSDN